MKKSLLLTSLLVAIAALAGCSHPNDLIDDIAQAAASTALA